jgi:hypothetical protein
MRSGCASSPSGRCCGPHLCRHDRFGSCGTSPATGPTWWPPGPPRSSGLSSCWRTPRSNSRWWPATSSGSPAGPCWPESATQGPGAAGPRPVARQTQPAGGGVHRVLHRPAGLPARMLARVDAPSPGGRAAGRDPRARPDRCAAAHRRARDGHDPVPDRRAPGVMAKYAPGVRESAGKRKGSGSTGHGNPYLARVLGEAAVAASKTNTLSASSKPSATRSRSNPPPDRPSPNHQRHAERIRAPPGHCPVPAHRGFSDQDEVPGSRPARGRQTQGSSDERTGRTQVDASLRQGRGRVPSGRLGPGPQLRRVEDLFPGHGAGPDAVPTQVLSRFLPPAQDDDAFYDLITSEGWGSGRTHKVQVQPSSRLGSPGWFSVGADCTTASSRGRSSPK